MMHYKNKKTLVLWSISSCPIPDGCDPRLVRPRIESALKKSGYLGPVSITAIGNLTQIHEDVLRELSSTGIALKYAQDIRTDFCTWSDSNPSPANVLFISGELELLAWTVDDLESVGCRILVAYPQRKSLVFKVSQEWLWKDLMSEDMDNKQEATTRLVLQDKRNETGESLGFCTMCRFAGQSFEDFSTHLKSERHAYLEWDGEASHKGLDLINRANLVWDRSELWDLLNKQSIEMRTRPMPKGPFKPLKFIPGKLPQEQVAECSYPL